MNKVYFPKTLIKGILKGSYVLILENGKVCDIRVGGLGVLKFDRGFYAYIGSMFGSGGLEARIRRYFVRGRKHWHIDYILDHMKIVEVFVLPEKDYESFLANVAVKRFNYVKGFGCSDKKNDVSHLIYFRGEGELRKFIELIKSIGFEIFNYKI
ncbi:MAG: GIY-YIG nuclease family protein [Nitrososphaeria archaeon]